MGADLHETAGLRLRDLGQRYTANRRAVVELLASTHAPLTIPELLAAGPGVAQSTAYRNLAVLEEAGVVRRLLTSGDFARYELAEDLTEHHHHLICVRCGSAEDYTVPTALERRLSRAVSEAEAMTGFEAEHHRLDLIGTCAGCRT